jgi:roadblock/LC7 domain-containing protein
MERAAETVAEAVVEAAVESGMMDEVAKVVVASGVLDQIAAHAPDYQEYQKRIREYAEQYEIYATAGKYASVVCGTVGVCLTLTGRDKTGYTLVVISVPIGYFSYNVNKVCENLENGFANHIIKHMVRKKGKDKIDLEKLKETLKKGTLCYNPFIEFHARHFMAHVSSWEKAPAKQSLSQ